MKEIFFLKNIKNCVPLLPRIGQTFFTLREEKKSPKAKTKPNKIMKRKFTEEEMHALLAPFEGSPASTPPSPFRPFLEADRLPLYLFSERIDAEWICEVPPPSEKATAVQTSLIVSGSNLIIVETHEGWVTERGRDFFEPQKALEFGAKIMANYELLETDLEIDGINVFEDFESLAEGEEDEFGPPCDPAVCPPHSPPSMEEEAEEWADSKICALMNSLTHAEIITALEKAIEAKK